MGEIKILITGYSSFEGFKQNPSQIVVENLRNELNTSELAKEIATESALSENIQLQIETEIIQVDYKKALAVSQNACLRRNVDVNVLKIF